MTTQSIIGGVVHQVPEDLAEALKADKPALERWHDITPLARNEWICWVITNKMPKTRHAHIKRTIDELKNGKRRPCCWAGCSHRFK